MTYQVIAMVLFYFYSSVSFARPPIVTSLLPWQAKVSILIPAYNKAPFLHRAIESALNQTLREIEVVVVDDGSTDSSPGLVRSFQARDSRVKLVALPHNLGTHFARIAGIAAAKGAFVLSLDADDVLLPEIANRTYEIAAQSNVDFVEFEALESASMDGPFANFSFRPMMLNNGSGIVMREMFAEGQLNWNLWKRLIRRATYLKAMELLGDDCKSQRIIYGEDKLHMGAVFLVANGFVHVQDVGYVYHRAAGENSEGESQQMIGECVYQLRYVERVIKQLYGQIANLTYRIDRATPAGFRARMEREIVARGGAALSAETE
jgi:glycosyltransferase involved in cell wall biosynthesis